MAVIKDVFLSIAPKLLDNGFIIAPIYHSNPNLDFKDLKIFKKGWNRFDRPDLVRTSADIEKINWDQFLCYLTLPSPGAVVLDVDTKTTEQRKLATNFMSALKEHGAPNTLMTLTPSGGVPLYYKVDGRFSSSKAGGCVDIQQAVPSGESAQGCYGPGCVRAEGLVYKVRDGDANVATLPLDIKEWIENPMSVDVTPTDLDYKGAINISPTRIEMGDRDNVLSGIAASMVRKGIDAESILDWLKFLRDTRTDNGSDFSDEVLKEKIQRVMSKKEFLPDDKEAVDILMDRLVMLRGSATIFDRVTRFEYQEQKAKVIYAKYKTLVESADGKRMIYKPAFEAWKSSELRDEADMCSYLPGEQEFFTDPTSGITFCNTYRGPTHAIPQGNFDDFIEAFISLCAHLWPEEPEYFLQYAAYLCQNERAKLEYMVVLISEVKGIGKNLYSEILSNLLGTTNVATTTVKDLTGNFNSNIVDSRLVIIDEMETRFHKKDYGEVKSMITSTVLSRKEKHLTDRTQAVRFTLLGFSNRLDQLTIENGDRRFWPINCKSGRLDKELELKVSPLASGKLTNMEKNHDAIDALWWYLKNEVKVTSEYLTPSARPPQTETKNEVQVNSMYGVAAVFAEMRNHNEGAFSGDIVTIPMVILSYYQKYGERLSMKEARTALKDNGLIMALIRQNGANGRQIYPPKIDLDPQVMSVTNQSSKEIGYACRNFTRYKKFVDYETVKAELQKGYQALHEAGSNRFNSADILPFPNEGEK